MKFSLRRPRSPLMIALFLSFVLLAGLFMGWISGHVISDDNAFRSLTDNIHLSGRGFRKYADPPLLSCLS